MAHCLSTSVVLNGSQFKILSLAVKYCKWNAVTSNAL